MARVNGRFAKGTSGNAKGRPRRADSAKATIKRDGWINDATGHGTARDRRTLTRYGVDIVTDLEALNLWRSQFLAARIIEALPKKALSRGWTLKLDDKERAEAVTAQAEALGLAKAFVKAWMFERAYGGAAIFPVMSGALGAVSEPLEEGAIASVDALHVFEPQELQPVDYYKDLNRPEFGTPETYRLIPLAGGRGGYLGSQIIHASRLIVFPGTRVSRQTQPGQREGWGDSCLCRPKEVLDDFGLAWGSAATLVHEHGKGTLAMDGFADMMQQADGLEVFDRHMEAQQMAWNTLRMMVVDGKSTYTRSTGTLGGLSEVLNEFKSLMSAAAGQPVSLLFGVGQTGLRTGDADLDAWFDTVEADRTDHLPLFERLVRFQLLATAGPMSGVEPDVWSVEFPPLRSPSEKEIADTRKTDMERAKLAIDSGVASADDVAESFYGGDTYSGDIVVDWNRRKAQAAVDEERAAELEQDQAALEAMGRGVAPTEPDVPPAPEQERRADGPGYNPNRQKDGKFGSGPHHEQGKKYATLTDHERSFLALKGGDKAAAAALRGKTAAEVNALHDSVAKKLGVHDYQVRDAGKEYLAHKATTAPAAPGRKPAAPEHPTHEDAARQTREAHEARVVFDAKQQGRLPGERATGAHEIHDTEHDRLSQEFGKSIDHKELLATENYASTHMVWNINASLRGQPLPNPGGVYAAEIPRHVKDIDSALKKAPALGRDATVYRGVKGGTALDKLKPGDVFTDKAYGSTSTRPDFAHQFTGKSETTPGVLMRITLPKGTRAAAIPSPFARTEREILLPRGHSIRVDRVVKSSIPGGPTEMFGTLVER